VEEYQDCLNYIDRYWDIITKTSPVDNFPKRIIALPKPFLIPNTKRFSFLFYWDSYFMMQGILGTNRQQLALDTVENFAYLFNKFKIIPNVSSYDFFSLAGFLPLWSGLASSSQAKKMIENLPRFESKFGLTITDKSSLSPKVDLAHFSKQVRITIDKTLNSKQWDYPFIWRPIEYLVVLGLIKYGFEQKAKEIMEKALKAEAKIFRKYGRFYEKMNGETGDIAKDFHYPNQGGFGWTNGVFYKYIQLLQELRR